MVAILACFGAVDASGDDAPAKDAAAAKPTIVGKWRVKTETWYGNEKAKYVGDVWEFGAKNRLIIRRSTGRVVEGRYELDAKRKTWRIDVEKMGDRREFGGAGPRKGIVNVKGAQLTLCVAGGADGPRPDKMASTRDRRTILRRMERIEKTK